MNLTDKQRLYERLVNKSRFINGCWLWGGYIDKSTGYGQMGIGDKIYLTHRVSAYISLGLELEGDHRLVLHKCPNHNRSCWSHIYLGNSSDNNYDAVKDGTHNNQNKGKTHCKNGHELSKNNTYINIKDPKHRRCMKCRNEASKRSRNKKLGNIVIIT